MFVYHGKCNSNRGVLLTIAAFIYKGTSGNSTPNDIITVVFPRGFGLNDPVIAFWQCSNDPILGNEKANVANVGFISTVAKASDGSGTVSLIHFSFGPYSFHGIVSANFKTLSLTMNDWIGSYLPFDLTASSINAANVHSVAVYTGSLKWGPFAEDELVTIVVPHGVAKDVSFGLFFQWTGDPLDKRTPKQPIAIKGEFQEVNPAVELEGGEVTATYKDSEGYKYTFTFKSDFREGVLVLSNDKVCPKESADDHFELVYKL